MGNKIDHYQHNFYVILILSCILEIIKPIHYSPYENSCTVFSTYFLTKCLNHHRKFGGDRNQILNGSYFNKNFLHPPITYIKVNLHHTQKKFFWFVIRVWCQEQPEKDLICEKIPVH